MPHISKRRKAFDNKVDRNKAYAAMDAMKLVKETATAKFDEAVDVAVNLGIDAKKGDQTVRALVDDHREEQDGQGEEDETEQLHGASPVTGRTSQAAYGVVRPRRKAFPLTRARRA